MKLACPEAGIGGRRLADMGLPKMLARYLTITPIP